MSNNDDLMKCILHIILLICLLIIFKAKIFTWISFVMFWALNPYTIQIQVPEQVKICVLFCSNNSDNVDSWVNDVRKERYFNLSWYLSLAGEMVKDTCMKVKSSRFEYWFRWNIFLLNYEGWGLSHGNYFFPDI